MACGEGDALGVATSSRVDRAIKTQRGLNNEFVRRLCKRASSGKVITELRSMRDTRLHVQLAKPVMLPRSLNQSHLCADTVNQSRGKKKQECDAKRNRERERGERGFLSHDLLSPVIRTNKDKRNKRRDD